MRKMKWTLGDVKSTIGNSREALTLGFPTGSKNNIRPIHITLTEPVAVAK